MPYRRFRRPRRVFSAYRRRGRRVLRGRGDYKSFFRGVWDKVGRPIWHSIRGPLGTAATGLAGAGIKYLTGMGDYRAKLNPKSLKYMSMVPGMHKAMAGGIRITHREQCLLPVGDAYNPAPLGPLYGNKDPSTWVICNGTARPFYLGPCESSLFPWLAKVAINFQQFRFLGLAFEYRPTSGESVAAQNPAIGDVTFSTVYDVYLPVPKTLYEQTALQYVNSSKPSQTFIHGIECNKRMLVAGGRFNVRKGEPDFADSTQGDQRLCYIGATTLSVSGTPYAPPGQQNPNVLGYVWATYDILVYQPTITPLGVAAAFDSDIHVVNATNTGVVSGDNASAFAVTKPFGEASLFHPFPFALDTASLAPVYGGNLPPGNDATGIGIAADRCNGFLWPFEHLGNELNTFWQVNLTYSGTGAATPGFQMGTFRTVGGAHFETGVLPTGVVDADAGSTASVVNVTFVIAIPPMINGAGFTIDGQLVASALGCQFPAGPVSVQMNVFQLPSNFPGLGVGVTDHFEFS